MTETKTKKAFKDWDISDSTSNLVYVGAWDTGAEHTSLSMKVIEAKVPPPPLVLQVDVM